MEGTLRRSAVAFRYLNDDGIGRTPRGYRLRCRLAMYKLINANSPTIWLVLFAMPLDAGRRPADHAPAYREAAAILLIGYQERPDPKHCSLAKRWPPKRTLSQSASRACARPGETPSERRVGRNAFSQVLPFAWSLAPSWLRCPRSPRHRLAMGARSLAKRSLRPLPRRLWTAM